ncbi:MAG TPA: alpha/beta-type small acid-soluble spore protein [Anaerovoracaceae bacterium]|nr:alpha/beta-type small acid-soluble spore protein [Anaerovoracaceae bacterium]
MSKQSNSETNSKLNKLKSEFAEETGIDISQYNSLNKGSLTSRQNGYVGGYIGGTMTKKLVEMAEKQLMEK